VAGGRGREGGERGHGDAFVDALVALLRSSIDYKAVPSKRRVGKRFCPLNIAISCLLYASNKVRYQVRYLSECYSCPLHVELSCTSSTPPSTVPSCARSDVLKPVGLGASASACPKLLA
jgi:hypothetical protein